MTMPVYVNFTALSLGLNAHTQDASLLCSRIKYSPDAHRARPLLKRWRSPFLHLVGWEPILWVKFRYMFVNIYPYIEYPFTRSKRSKVTMCNGCNRYGYSQSRRRDLFHPIRQKALTHKMSFWGHMKVKKSHFLQKSGGPKKWVFTIHMTQKFISIGQTFWSCRVK